MPPILLTKARTVTIWVTGELVDSMIHDGLWDVYNQFHMGAAAEICARMLEHHPGGAGSSSRYSVISARSKHRTRRVQT